MFWLLVVIVGCSQFIFGAAGEVVSLVNHKRENGEIGLVRDVLEKVLLDSRGPIFIWTALGNSRVGKSTFINFFQNQMVKQRRNADSSEPSYFEVCHHLLPCTKGMLATAVSRGGDSGIDVFIDAEGGNLAEKVQPMSVFLTIAACISSGPIVLLDTELNDNTFSLVSRIAGHMLDPNAIELGSSCSFRQGGPRIMIIVNRNDGAVLQEAAPGGLQTIWDMIAAERPHENMVQL